MPYYLNGTDAAGPLPLNVRQLANGAHVLKRKRKRADGSVEETVVPWTLARPVPPLSAEIRYSPRPDRTGDRLVALAEVKQVDWYVWLNTNEGLSHQDVKTVTWYVDGVRQVIDSATPYELKGSTAAGPVPWHTTSADNGTRRVKAVVERYSTPGSLFEVEALLTVQHSAVALKWADEPPGTFNPVALVKSPIYFYPRSTDTATADYSKAKDFPVNARTARVGGGTQLVNHAVLGGYAKGNGFKGASAEDLKVVMPDEPLDTLGGLYFENWRSVEVGVDGPGGGEIYHGHLWPQVIADKLYGAGNRFARLDSYVQPNNATLNTHKEPIWGGKNADGSDVLGRTNIERIGHVSITNRGFGWQNVLNMFAVGLAFGGPWMFENFFMSPVYDAKLICKAYLQCIDLRSPLIWRNGWNKAFASFDIAHNGGDFGQMFGPIQLFCDDFRVDEMWYQGFILKPGDASLFRDADAPRPSAEFRHFVIRNYRGYGGGAIVYVVHVPKDNLGNPKSNQGAPWPVTANHECYIGPDKMNYPRDSWPTGQRGRPIADSTDAEGVIDAYFPEGKQLAGMTARDQYTHPTHAPKPGAAHGYASGPQYTVAECVNADAHTFGASKLGVDPDTGDHFAYFGHTSILRDAAGRTATSNPKAGTYDTTYYADDWLDYKIWDLRDRQPKYEDWPGGINSGLGAFLGWSRAGIGFS